ncbi:MAG: phosphohistidine phosphatase SixA [Phycisphaerae bacterium]
MRVYLIQHGEAKSKQDDPDRPLTDGGLANVQKMAGFLRPLHLRVRAVWHSGKTRAAQTAEQFASAVQSGEGVVQRDGLAPMDDVKPVRRKIEKSEGDLMIVGHLPFLSKLAAVLLTGKESPEPIAFQNAGVVCLERSDAGTWQVRWLITPDALAGI